MPKPIRISGSKVRAILDLQYSLKNLGKLEIGKYYHRKSMTVYARDGK